VRLNENKDFSYAEAQKDFGFNPLAFEEGIKSELKSLQAQAAVLAGKNSA
jgi:hypothetical protein